MNKIDTKKRFAKFDEQEKYLKKLFELYEREKQSRCYFQLERDKLMNIREVEKTKYEEMKSKLILMSEKVSQLEYFHNKEMTNISRKVQYLIGEREMKVNDLKLELNQKSKEELKVTMDANNSCLNGLRSHLNTLNEKVSNFDELIKNISNDYENKISKLNLEYSEALKIVQNTSSDKFKNERETFSLITRNAINEITELKNAQLGTMKQLKNKSFDDLRDYFQDLTKNLIESVDKLQRKNTLIERNLEEKKTQLEVLSKELKEAKHENESLKAEMKSFLSISKIYKSAKNIYQAKNIQFAKLTDKHKELDLKYEEILSAYLTIKKERDKLYDYIGDLVRTFKKKVDTINFISNKKSNYFEVELNKYEQLVNDFKLKENKN